MYSIGEYNSKKNVVGNTKTIFTSKIMVPIRSLYVILETL